MKPPDLEGMEGKGVVLAQERNMNCNTHEWSSNENYPGCQPGIPLVLNKMFLCLQVESSL